MKDNRLVTNLLRNIKNLESKVFFKNCRTNEIVPLSDNYYEVENTLILFRYATEKDGAKEEYKSTVRDILNSFSDNCYACGEDYYPDYSVAVSDLLEWDDDTSGFNSMLAITDAVEIDGKVILTTEEYDTAGKDFIIRNVQIAGRNQKALDSFMIDMKKASTELKHGGNIIIL